MVCDGDNGILQIEDDLLIQQGLGSVFEQIEVQNIF